MKEKKGGIKTSILLFSLVLLLSLMLFLFVFSIFSNNKIEITKKLTNVNECANINYDVLNTDYKENALTITLKNNANSRIIQKIFVLDKKNIYQENISINPNEIRKINIKEVALNNPFQIYVNDCDEYMKTISAS